MRIKVLAQNDGLADQCQEYTHTLFKLPLGSISLNAYPKYGITDQQAKTTTCDLLYAQRETGKLRSKIGKEK